LGAPPELWQADPGVALQVIVNGCPTVGVVGVADKLIVTGATVTLRLWLALTPSALQVKV